MNAAAPGTTLVSATTRELTIGAGLDFVDRGQRTFKGISGEPQVYEAQLAGRAPAMQGRPGAATQGPEDRA